MLPSKRFGIPVEPTGKIANLVEIAFQVGEAILASRFSDALFARHAGCADGGDADFVGRTALQAISAADFKQSQVMLTSVQIPGQCVGHAHKTGRAQQGSIFGERICYSRGRDTSGPKKGVFRFVD